MSKMSIFLILMAMCVAESGGFLNIKQSYEVHGKLLCGADPMEHVQVVLYDLDADGAEELMAAGTTHADGTFSLKGQASDGVPAIDDIEPHIKIYYKCNEPLTQTCNSKVVIELPARMKYFTDGHIFELGVINMEAKFQAPFVDCQTQ